MDLDGPAVRRPGSRSGSAAVERAGVAGDLDEPAGGEPVMAPIVIVARGEDGYADKAVWFETESAFYNGHPTLRMEFDRRFGFWTYIPVRSTSWRLGLRAADVIERLER